MRPERPNPAAPGGFTLIETIVVLVVLGLMAGLILSRGPMRSPVVDVRAAATDVMEAMRVARARAIAADRPVALTLAKDATAFRLDDDKPAAFPRGVTAKLRFGRAHARALLFLPDGSGSGGTVVLANARARAEVTVNWLTGRIAVTDKAVTETP